MSPKARWWWARAHAPIGCLVLCAFAAGGLACSSPTSSDDPPPDGLDVGDVPGEVSGYLLDDNGLHLVASPGEVSAAATPVAGARIALTAWIGDGTFEATTASDGSYDLSGIPHGAYRLEVNRAGHGGEPDLTEPLSVVPGGRIVPGAAYAVSRDDAIVAVTDLGFGSKPGAAAAASDPVILGVLQPLPEGTRITATGADEGRPDGQTTLDAPAWFFFVDLEPGSAYAHPVEYVLVDASTGDVTRIQNLDAPPVVNGTRMWSSDRDYIRYENVTFGPAGLEVSGDARAVTTPEVVSLPESSSARPRSSLPSSAPNIPAETDPRDLFSLSILTGNGSSMWRSMNLWADWLNRQGVPQANQRSLLVPTITETGWNAELGAVRSALYADIEKRVAEGGKPILIVYMIGHHPDWWEGPTGKMRFEFANGSEKDNTIGAVLGLRLARSCVIHLFLDTCFAERLAKDLIASLSPIDLLDRPDLKIYASSRETQTSKGRFLWQELVSFGFLEAGSTFTKEFVKRMTLEDGEIAGIFFGRRFIAALDPLRTGVFTQSPVYSRLVAIPQWCEGWGIPLIDALPPGIDVHHPPSAPCPESLGRITLASRVFEQLEWTATSTHPAIRVEPASGVIGAGNGADEAEVFYDCEPPGPVSAAIRFTVRGYDGALETIVDIPVRVRVDGLIADTVFVRHPGAFSGGTYSLWHPIPEGVRVDSTRTVDLATGLPPVPQPWSPASDLEVTRTYEGPHLTLPNYYGVSYEVDNSFSSETCPECPTLSYLYTVYFRYPDP